MFWGVHIHTKNSAHVSLLLAGNPKPNSNGPSHPLSLTAYTRIRNQIHSVMGSWGYDSPYKCSLPIWLFKHWVGYRLPIEEGFNKPSMNISSQWFSKFLICLKQNSIQNPPNPRTTADCNREVRRVQLSTVRLGHARVQCLQPATRNWATICIFGSVAHWKWRQPFQVLFCSFHSASTCPEL